MVLSTKKGRGSALCGSINKKKGGGAHYVVLSTKKREGERIMWFYQQKKGGKGSGLIVDET